MMADDAAKDHVAQAGFLLLTQRADLDVEIDQRNDRVKAEVAAEYFLRRDPDDARRDRIGAHTEIDRHAIAVVVAQLIGLIMTEEHHAVQAGRGKRGSQVILRAHGIDRATRFRRLRLSAERCQ